MADHPEQLFNFITKDFISNGKKTISEKMEAKEKKTPLPITVFAK